eukprot:CAMPEP_0171170000 /NCGR_PEP_ID=MMETSP0790-20130122/8494_1 /TAXON_ID=2925 /ORGANISM="Alexandrium catenella, Strain OF101" /LENGTH=82 /DNA_ID=CAMNT_0011634845 /DNA_START=25 /DNA_END=270 /DNA_ORIENTATION=-
MKALGEWNPAFAGVASPVTCCEICERVFSAPAQLSLLQKAPAAMTAKQCKTTCHRFGMKSLGGNFAQLTSPVECAALCEQTY